MQLVLFAISKTCCTHCFDGQRNVCDASMRFVSQVTFSLLDMLLIFFVTVERTFSSMWYTFYLQWLIFGEKIVDPNTVPGDEGVHRWLIGVMCTFDVINCCCWIYDKRNEIFFIIIMNNTFKNNIALLLSHKKIIIHKKNETWTWTLNLITISPETALERCR